MKRVKYLILFVLLLALAGAAQAKLTPMFPNSDFEMGDLTNWHTTGQCWQGNAPSVGDPWTIAPQGRWLAASTCGGPPYPEPLTGNLISSPFTVLSGFDKATFFICGWADPNLRVEFRKASDDSLLFTQQVPGTSANFTPVSISGFSAYASQSIYITVIDQNLAAAPDGPSGWIGVDAFTWNDGAGITPPANANRLFLNSDFETGDLTNWTPSGSAFNHNPSIGEPWDVNPEHTYCMSSTNNSPANPELDTGTLTSTSFPIPAGRDTIKFFMAGYLDSGFKVEFHLSSDNSVIATGQMPATSGTFVKIYVNGFAAYAGQSIYIVLIDNNRQDSEVTNNWYGWMAVDGFEWDVSTTNPNVLFPNSDFEVGDLSNWTPEGEAWNHDPTLGYPPFGAAPDGTKSMCSAPPEGNVGSLTSIPFTVPAGKDAIKFFMAGYSQVDFRVEFHKASDNSLILTKRLATTSQSSNEVMVKGFSAYVGQQIYIKVFDEGTVDLSPDGTAGWFGWLMVDGFQWGVIALEPQNVNKCFDNAGFELSDYSNWTQSGGTAFGTDPIKGNGFFAQSPEATFAASSAAAPGTGKLTSVAFKMAKPGIGFAIAGWNHAACMVNLRLASDNSLVASAQNTFNSTFWHGAVLNGWTAWGKQVYLEVVDTVDSEDVTNPDSTVTTNHPWIAADDFHFIEGTQVPVELSAFSAE